VEVLVVEFRIAPAHVDAFAAAIADNARASRETEPGCRRFDVCRDRADPQSFFLYELYDDEAAVAAHLAAPHFVAMSEMTASWVEAKRVQRFFRTAP